MRIPITWSNHHGPGPSYTIDAAWLSRVRQVVDWALADNFYVMINLHHDSWQWINTYPTDRANVLSRYTALWSQISAAFRNHSAKLLFESINEPQFAGTSGDEQNYQLLGELNAEFVRLVRASGGGNSTRLLVLPTLFTNADQGRLDSLRNQFTQLRDPNLVATIHFYGFWPFSVNIAGFTRVAQRVPNERRRSCALAYFFAALLTITSASFPICEITRPARAEVICSPVWRPSSLNT